MLRRAGWLPSHSAQQQAGCSQASHWEEYTLAQVYHATFGIYACIESSTALSATTRSLLMVKIYCLILQDPIPLGVAHQARQGERSSSMDSFVLRRQLTGFLYLCTMHVPWSTMSFCAMPCHLEGLSFFHFAGPLLEKHRGSTHDTNVIPCLGVFQKQQDVFTFSQLSATSSTRKIRKKNQKKSI